MAHDRWRHAGSGEPLFWLMPVVSDSLHPLLPDITLITTVWNSDVSSHAFTNTLFLIPDLPDKQADELVLGRARVKLLY